MSNADTPIRETTTPPQPDTQKRRKTVGKIIAGFGILLILLVLVFLATQATFEVKGGSMAPALLEGQKLFINTLDHQPARGDIVTYLYPPDPQYVFVHRVIGLPGETITIQGGHVLVNGTVLDEPYLHGAPTECQSGVPCRSEPVVVPADHLFLMADNRTRAIDSRDYGPVSVGMVTGRVWMVYAPADAMKLIGRPAYPALSGKG